MKKLIISAIAAASLLFGFASCSGDLHDDEYKVIDLSNGAIPGDFDSPANWDNTTSWSSIDAASNTYVFNFKTKSDLSGNVGFKILTENGSWNVDGYTEVDVTVGSGAVTIPMKSASAMGGAGDANIVGCKPGGNYTMTVIANPDTTISVKVEAAEAGAVQADPTPYYFDGLYLVGGVFKLAGKENAYAFDTTNLLWGATTDKKTGVVTYTKDIVATAASGELGINDSSWNNKQNGSGVTIAAGEAAKPLDGTEGNFKVTGLTIGNPYRVTITTTPEKVVSVKVVQLNEVKLTLNVSDLPDALNGVDFYLRGTMNGWVGDDTYKATVTSNALSVSWNYTYEGTSFEKDYECKFGPKGAWDPQLSAAGPQNLTIKFKDAAATLNYKYNGSSGKDDEGNTYYVIVENK